MSYIVAIDNLSSIVRHGILSHQEADAHPHVSVADVAVQARRANKIIGSGRGLHEYANLYFWPRNGMMSAVRDQDVCVLTVSPAVLDLPGVWYRDRNAAKGDASFAQCNGDFELIESRRLYNGWFAGDPEAMGYTQAEVLVPDSLEPKFFRDVVVDTQEKQSRVEALQTGLQVILRPRWFFA